jgi:hypothetical protein
MSSETLFKSFFVETSGLINMSFALKSNSRNGKAEDIDSDNTNL